MEVEEIKENKSKRLNYTLWVEKYRPASVKDIILPTALRRLFNKYIEAKEIPNLLLASVKPGVGKTTLAKAISNDIDADYLYINCSLENGIDVLRNRIEKFATSISMNGNKKIVIGDEFDGTSLQFQSALRGFIEQFHESCRFILTCNYLSKIIKPIRDSRITLIDFNMADKKTQEEMIPRISKRLEGICKLEKVEYLPETITEIVTKCYPDMRRMINLLQRFSKQNGIINNDIFNHYIISEELISLILKKQFSKARSFIIQSAYAFEELYRSLYDNLIPKLPKDKQANAIIVIAEYMNNESRGCLDSEINFAACMLEIMSLI